MNGQTKPLILLYSYRVACPQLKKKQNKKDIETDTKTRADRETEKDSAGE